MKKSILAFCLIILVGCATVGTAPSDCPDSLIWKNKQIVDTVLPIAVTGFHVLAATKPAIYALAHKSAQVAANLLRSQPVSLSALTDNAIINMFTPLMGLIPMDKILCKYDREYIAGYLEQI